MYGISETLWMFSVFVLGNICIGFFPLFIIGKYQYYRWPNVNRFKLPNYLGSLYGVITSLAVGFWWTYKFEYFSYIDSNWKILVYLFSILGGYLIAQLYFSFRYPVHNNTEN